MLGHSHNPVEAEFLLFPGLEATEATGYVPACSGLAESPFFCNLLQLPLGTEELEQAKVTSMWRARNVTESFGTWCTKGSMASSGCSSWSCQVRHCWRYPQVGLQLESHRTLPWQEDVCQQPPQKVEGDLARPRSLRFPYQEGALNVVCRPHTRVRS